MKKPPLINGADVRLYDRVEVYNPRMSYIKKIAYIPGKTIYINRAAKPEAKVIKICFDEYDLLETFLNGTY